jgi:hypothetical protein
VADRLHGMMPLTWQGTWEHGLCRVLLGKCGEQNRERERIAGKEGF